MTEATASTTQAELVSHFWVSAYPYFDSSLISVQSIDSANSDRAQIRLDFLDADGRPFNEVSLSYDQRETGILELEPFMSGCKLESGMKHAHLVVRSPKNVRHQLRIHTREAVSFLGALAPLNRVAVPCLPIWFSERRSNFLSVINQSEIVAQVKCRLFFGSRSPELVINIPPLGIRLIHLESQFPEISAKERGVQAYARLVTLNEASCGVQFLECAEGPNGANLFSSVT